MSESEDIRGPLGVTHRDEEPAGWCEVTCVLPELKVKKKFEGGKLKDRPESGKFNCKFNSRSLDFEIECSSKSKKQIKYVYNVRKLPDEIVEAESKVKYKQGKVVLSLKKVESRSWQRELSTNGLDQHIDPEDDLEKGE